ncbi:MAG: N-acetyl-alpha-D-glucosaminyl L-malate synthase BshA, partial [Flavobacteriales bacterium]|nr:N-acetyl-alpha-D-glucosaminyl L-malate synthase BshA [Flavobacteriales bacterium]
MSNVGDIKDMAKNAVDLLSNEDKLSQFRVNALKHARKFNIDYILPRYEALYESLIERSTTVG